MIKLTDILKEAESPVTGKGGEKIAAFKPKNPEDIEALKRGYKSIKTSIDPETGQMTTEFEALPKFDDIRRKILMYRKEFQPFKFSNNEDIAKLSKDLNTTLTKASQMIFALDRMLELQKKTEK
jgi:hypothetical protein